MVLRAHSAGALAADCLTKNLPPRQVRNSARHLRKFQTLLQPRGIEAIIDG